MIFPHVCLSFDKYWTILSYKFFLVFFFNDFWIVHHSACIAPDRKSQIDTAWFSGSEVQNTINKRKKEVCVFTHLWQVPGSPPRPPRPATRWSCWYFLLWWYSSRRFGSDCLSTSEVALLAFHSSSWLQTSFGLRQQTQNRHFWKQIHKVQGRHCLDRPQTFPAKKGIQQKSTKRQRLAATCPQLLLL